MKQWSRKGWRGCWLAVLIALVGARALRAQPIVIDVNGDPEEEIARAIEQGQAASADAAPTTNPTSRPSERLAKFRIRFGRTALTSLQALSQTLPEDADDVAKFRADVLAGRWEAVGKTVATFSPAEAKLLYRHVLTDLMQPPPPQPPQGGQPGIPGEPSPPQPRGIPPQIYLSPDDVLGLAAAVPGELEQQDVDLLGRMLARVVSQNTPIEPTVARLQQGVGSLGGTDSAARQRAAALLLAANRPREAFAFLPAINADPGAADPEVLELQSKCLTALATSDPEKATQAWDITRALLAHPKATAKQQESAISRAMELLPRLPKETSTKWLESAFTGNAEQGVSVLAGAGSAVSRNFLSRNMDQRESDLMQQKAVVDQLLADTKDVSRWRPLLEALASLWMQEADYARARPTQRQLAMQQRVVYDDLGEPVSRPVVSNDAPPLEPSEVLASAPSEAWLKVLDPARQAAIRANLVQMHFKNDTPEAAMPLIETLAAEYPKMGRDLCNDLLRNIARVWSSSLASSRSVSYYINSSGSYTPVTQNIVLTRLAQARNLAKLEELLRKIEKLPIEPVDQSAIVQAFVSAHSPAEVFRIENINAVFGPSDKIGSDALYSLVQTMRQRLASGWRSTAIQAQQQTKRTDKETDAEVRRGYQLVIDLLKQRLEHESDWKLLVLEGSTLFDWAEFDYGKQVELAVYTARRDEAFAAFRKATEVYVAGLPKLKPEEQSPLVFTQWFNAALGASDLAALTRQSTPSPTQIELIRTSLFGLPEQYREKHLSGFGKFLADAVNSLRPELKFKFLTTGIQILGDHESARDAQMLVQYYQELLKEVELYAEVDGDPVVGHGKPFGLHLMVRHTETLGRESGGFAKYLSGSGSSGSIMSTSGQPLNFRDEIEKKMRESLVERFQIISIAWHDQKVEPMSYGKPGWRQTPLAYVVLKPKDASVDKIPPVQMDLDLVDRQGTVILPISSQVVLIDSRPDSAPPRPVSKIEITQILDQRDVASGKLSLDIKATATGLLPDLSDLLDTTIPGFTIDKTSDMGLVVNRMDDSGERPAPISERNWLINLSASRNDDSPLSFRFPQARVADAKMVYRQYSDADVSDVDPQLAVIGLPIRSSRTWIYGTIVGVLVLIGAGTAIAILRRRTGVSGEEVVTYQMPGAVNPFTVLELLRRIEGDPALKLASEHRTRLTSDIAALQKSYFSPPGSNGNGQSDLAAIASHWVGQARRN